jgi:hypothetical protein
VRTVVLAIERPIDRKPSYRDRKASYPTVDGAPFLVESPPSIVALFGQPRRLRDVADGHIGMHTRDNRRYLAVVEGFERRGRRVVRPAEPGWRPYLKEGGEKDFWHPVFERIDWRPRARAAYVIPKGGLFGRAGLCVSGVSRRLSARVMPAGCHWDTNKVIGLVPHAEEDSGFLLGLLNSDLYTYVAKRLLNESTSLQLNDLWKLPVPDVRRERISALAEGCVEGTRRSADISRPRRELNEEVYRELGIVAQDRELVRGFLRRQGLAAHS